jgi:phosphoesterase RecJ-like protein
MTKRVRPQRVAESIRQEIASLLSKGLKDPRIGFVSVMRVNMSPDLRYADVYVSLFGSEGERKASLIALRNSAGWVRREIGKAIRMRFTPEVRFLPDDTLDTVYHLEEVFERMHEEEKQTPMRRLSLEDAVDELRGAESVIISTHAGPDGDAVGSMLGMAQLLKTLGKKLIKCVMADPVPDTYSLLPGAEHIVSHASESIADTYDLAILLDAGNPERAGDAEEVLSLGKRLLIIDHHLDEGPHGAMGIIDSSYAATGEIVAELFAAAEVPLTRDAATCLYVAQVTDTGSYRYSNTSARSHAIASRLHDAGIDASGLCEAIFERMRKPEFALLRMALERMEFRDGGRVAFTMVTEQDVAAIGARKEDLNNIANYARNIEGVEVGILFKGIGPEETKVSMRSRDGFDAAGFLRDFGGGGHAAAAGATINQDVIATRDMLLKALTAKLEEK